MQAHQVFPGGIQFLLQALTFFRVRDKRLDYTLALVKQMLSPGLLLLDSARGHILGLSFVPQWFNFR